jgi:hypothetical protein
MGKFSEALHPRGKDGKFTSGGGKSSGGSKADKLANKLYNHGGRSPQEKLGVAIGSKIADVRVASAKRSAARNKAAVAARNASEARYVAETGDHGNAADRARIASRNAKNTAKAKKASSTARRITTNRKKSKG